MKTKILILESNPNGGPFLRLGKEIKEIEDLLQRSKNRSKFQIIRKSALQQYEFDNVMLEENPIFVHFCGHGNEECGILFEDAVGNAKRVDNDVLAGLFKLFSSTVNCVVLNACYSEQQAQVIAQYIPYVIGIKKEISDNAAIKFSCAFYGAIFSGKKIEFAFDYAINEIQPENLSEENIPKLINQISNTVAKLKTVPDNKSTLPELAIINPSRDNEYRTKIEGFLSDADVLLKKIYKKSTSTIMTNGFENLFLRTKQFLQNNYTSSIIDDIQSGVLGFLKLTLRYIRDISAYDSVVMGLNALNKLLDNREIMVLRENEVGYSKNANSWATIITGYAQIVSKVLCFINDYDQEDTEYYSFLTLDACSEVVTTHLFPGSLTIKLINICLPKNMICSIKYILGWSVNALGHFSQIGWDIETRNIAFLNSVSLYFHFLLRNNGFAEPQIDRIISKINNSPVSKTLGLNFFIEDLQKLVLSMVNKNNKSFKDISDNIAKMNSEVVSSLLIFLHAYNESIADVFMIELLGIKTQDVYLEMVSEYFKNQKTSLNKISSHTMIRIGVVLSLFFEESKETLDEYSFMEMCKKNCEIEINRNIGDKKAIYSTVYQDIYLDEWIMLSCYPLYIFLRNSVKSGFETNYKNDNLFIEKLRAGYNLLSENKYKIKDAVNFFDSIFH